MKIIRIVCRSVSGELLGSVDGEVIVRGAAVLGPAARVLLHRGVDPATPVNMRWAHSDHDSFVTMPLAVAARCTA